MAARGGRHLHLSQCYQMQNCEGGCDNHLFDYANMRGNFCFLQCLTLLQLLNKIPSSTHATPTLFCIVTVLLFVFLNVRKVFWCAAQQIWLNIHLILSRKNQSHPLRFKPTGEWPLCCDVSRTCSLSSGVQDTGSPEFHLSRYCCMRIFHFHSCWSRFWL